MSAPAYRPLGHYAEADLPCEPPDSDHRPLVREREEPDLFEGMRDHDDYDYDTRPGIFSGSH